MMRVAIEARNTLRCLCRLRASVEQISAALRRNEISHRDRRVERAPRGVDSACGRPPVGGSGSIHDDRDVSRRSVLDTQPMKVSITMMSSRSTSSLSA